MNSSVSSSSSSSAASSSTSMASAAGAAAAADSSSAASLASASSNSSSSSSSSSNNSLSASTPASAGIRVPLPLTTTDTITRQQEQERTTTSDGDDTTGGYNSSLFGSCNAVDFLFHRQTTGCSKYYLYNNNNTIKQLQRNQPFPPLFFSSTLAWSVSRLQNMVLAVGPNTPASLVSSRDPLASSDEEEDEEEDEDEESDNDNSQQDDQEDDVFDDDNEQQHDEQEDDDDEILQDVDMQQDDDDDNDDLMHSDQEYLHANPEDDHHANDYIHPLLRHLVQQTNNTVRQQQQHSDDTENDDDQAANSTVILQSDITTAVGPETHNDNQQLTPPQRSATQSASPTTSTTTPTPATPDLTMTSPSLVHPQIVVLDKTQTEDDNKDHHHPLDQDSIDSEHHHQQTTTIPTEATTTERTTQSNPTASLQTTAPSQTESAPASAPAVTSTAYPRPAQASPRRDLWLKSSADAKQDAAQQDDHDTDHQREQGRQDPIPLQPHTMQHDNDGHTVDDNEDQTNNNNNEDEPSGDDSNNDNEDMVQDNNEDDDDNVDEQDEDHHPVRVLYHTNRRRRQRQIALPSSSRIIRTIGARAAAANNRGNNRFLRNNNNNNRSTNNNNSMLNGATSIRHGGCINTACWLDVPWRLSTLSPDENNNAKNVRVRINNNNNNNKNSIFAVPSDECPTQLITSGDDRLVKFWDVSGPMGMDNPLPGGWNTYCPFSATATPSVHELRKEWKQYYSSNNHHQNRRNQRHQSSSVINQQQLRISGAVRLLATLSTGHRGNVFHVTPLPCQPGKVLTCGADGYLRLGDLVADSSSVVVLPYIPEDEFNNSPFVIHSGMAYSHTLLTPHTGLLCSDRGLHHFDIRLPPRGQSRSSLLVDVDGAAGRHKDSLGGWRSGLCKACAVWNPHGSQSSSSDSGAVESHYIFAGGASETVGLYDIRVMGDASSRGGSGSKLIERYKPHWLDTDGRVSVSGLDVSRNGRELLVSYESDQIYAFPILQSSMSSSSTVSMRDIEKISDRFSNDTDLTVDELASYGSHLNRFTFLKNARYAGPNDEYICTGSDSGHAWFYERKTGTVAALLGADSSTCNGVIPHPTLPFFVTYGIDTTAKVWRATQPVDPATDDSPAGRLASSLRQPYEMSPVTRAWDAVRTQLNHFDTEPSVMPDMIASSEEQAASGRFSSLCRRGMCGLDSPRLGNSLASLPMILRQNHYECYKSQNEELDVPIEHPLVGLTQRVSLSRLRNQADRLGVKWQPWAPWAFEARDTGTVDIHPADLVPDYPSDWINYDPNMRKDDRVFAPRAPFLSTPYYENGLTELHFPCFFQGKDQFDGIPPWIKRMEEEEEDEDGSNKNNYTNNNAGYSSPALTTTAGESKHPQSLAPSTPPPFMPAGATVTPEVPKEDPKIVSRDLLFKTVKLLKEGGNEAMKEGMLNTAARRYDKAIQYAAVVFMQYGERSDLYLSDGDVQGFGRNKIITEWSPLLHLLITSRLNMALLLLKPEFSQPEKASVQALAAVKLLSPFTVRKGKVIHIRDETEIVLKEHEPEEHYYEAMTLKAKAFFRLGSGELASGDYSGAIASFEASLKCGAAAAGAGSSTTTTTTTTTKPDCLTVRRLQEARRRQKNKKKRERAKFQRLLCSDEHESA